MSDTTAKVILTAQDDISRVLGGVNSNFAKAAQAAQAAGKGMSSGLSEAARAAGQYVDANGRVRDANNRFAVGIKANNDQVAGSSRNLATTVKGALDKVGGAFTSAAHTAGNAAKAIAGAAAAAAKAIAGVMMAVGGFALAATVGAVKLASDFEATMNDFKMAAGDNLGAAGLSADDFTKKFLQLGKDTKYSSKQAAEAGVELVKAGMDIKSVMGDATEATLNLAAAAKSELAPTARIVAQQVQTWADQGANATDTSNMLAQALNASTITTLDNLALGLANVNGVAKAAGATQEDVVIAMAATSKKFADASDQGTAFKSMLQALVGPSKDAKGMMRELGLMTFDYAKAQQYLEKQGIKTDGSARQINVALDKLTKKFKMSKSDAQAFFASFEQNQFYDAEGKFKGMQNAAEILKKSLEGLSDLDKSEALKTIFGSDGIRFAQALSEQGAEGFNNMADAMKRTGTAAEQAAKLNQGLAFVIETIKGSVESVAIAFALKLLPLLSAIGEGVLLPLVNGFGDWIDTLDFTGISAENLKATIAGVMPQIQAAIASAFTTIGPIIESAKTIFWSLAGVIGNIYTAIANNWPQISGAITSAFDGVASVVQGALIPIVTGVIETFASVVTWVVTNWPQISNTIATVIGIVGTIFTTVLMPQIQWAIDLFKEIVGWVQTNWPLIAATFEAGVPMWKAILGALVLAFVTTWEMIKASIGSIITLILGLLKASMQIMQGDTSGALQTLFETFDKIFKKILEAVKVPINMVAPFISEKFGEIKGYLAAQVSTFYELGKNIVMGLLNAIIDFGDTVKNKIIEMIMGPLGYVKSLLGIHSPSDEMYWVGQMIGIGLANGIEDTIGAVTDAMASMHSAMFDAFGSPSMQFAGDAGAAIGAILGGGDSSSGATGAVNDALSAIGANPPGQSAPPSHADEAPAIHIGTVNVNNQADADYLINKLRDHLLRR